MISVQYYERYCTVLYLGGGDFFETRCILKRNGESIPPCRINEMFIFSSKVRCCSGTFTNVLFTSLLTKNI